MQRQQQLDVFAIMVVMTLCAVWGAQQVAIKLAIAEVPPLWQSGMRSFGATVLVGLWIVLAKHRWTTGLLGPGLFVGLFFAVEFGLFYFALKHTDAARAALLIYTAPFVVAIGAHFGIKGDRLSPLGWFGVFLAFMGTGIVLRASLVLESAKLVGDICAMAAGLAWGLTTLAVRITGLSEAAPSQILFYQLSVSGLLLCLAGLVFEGDIRIPVSGLVYSSLAFQIVGVATISYLAWFAMLARYSATTLSAFTFLTPVFGALAGVWLLGEQVDRYHIIALSLVISGIVIVNLYGHQRTIPASV